MKEISEMNVNELREEIKELEEHKKILLSKIVKNYKMYEEFVKRLKTTTRDRFVLNAIQQLESTLEKR